ncbi:MAG: hypothetical protein H3C62_09250 [Gemmatimonadaceae bacterium]|nr:hypothetical protein [Gemmatimonadaceae bacterium]
MSERRRLFVAAALALAWAPALVAQQDRALVAERNALRARVDSLRALEPALRAAADDSGLVDTVRVATLRLRTTPALASVAQSALALALEDARRVLGADADSVAARLALTLRENRTTARRRFSSLIGTTIVPTPERITSVTLDGQDHGVALAGARLDYPIDAEALRASVLMVFERSAGSRLAPETVTWLNGRVPLRATRAALDEELYRALATSDAAVVRRCAAGDRAACRLGFGLDSLPTDRVGAWYEASDLPALAKRSGDPMQRSALSVALSIDERDACTVARQIESCRRMIALLPATAFRIPMPDVARASLARLALEIGGPQAFDRWRANQAATVGEQLAAAASIDTDELVARWMARIQAARPKSPLPGPTFALASLACVLVCAGVALRGQPWN